MEGELGAEIDFVGDNVDHNQITINCNTSYNRGDGCMHSCSDTSRQDPYIIICRRVATIKVKEC